MNVLFLIILAIILFISILYLNFIVQIKINITIAEAAIFIKFKILKFHKDFAFRLNYFELIKRYFLEKRERKSYKKELDLFKSIFKAFFIKNIDIYSELFEDRLSIAVKFNVVNIITKKAILNE